MLINSGCLVMKITAERKTDDPHRETTYSDVPDLHPVAVAKHQKQRRSALMLSAQVGVAAGVCVINE